MNELAMERASQEMHRTIDIYIYFSETLGKISTNHHDSSWRSYFNVKCTSTLKIFYYKANYPSGVSFKNESILPVTILDSSSHLKIARTKLNWADTRLTSRIRFYERSELFSQRNFYINIKILGDTLNLLLLFNEIFN